MIAWAGAERLALGLTDTLEARPHARWLLSDVKGPPRPAIAAPAVEQPAGPSKQAPTEADEPEPQ